MEAFDTRRIPLRFHMLRAIDKSPRHCFQKIRAAVDGDDEESREMKIGTAADNMLFGLTPVVVAPMKRDPRSKAWQSFELENAGAHIVSQSEYDSACYMVDSIRANAQARELLEATGVKYGQTQLFERSGRQCRKTPDIWHPAFIADLKTSEDASPQGFPYKMRTYDIAGQLEWYRGADQPCFIIVCEQKTCITQVYEVKTSSLERARVRNDQRLVKVLEWEEKGVWPGYGSDVLSIDQAEY